MDLTIKNVPEGCEDAIKLAVMEVIEKFIAQRDLKIPDEVIATYQSSIDTIRVANNMDSKFNTKIAK